MVAGVPAVKRDVEFVLLIGTIRVVHESVVPLQADVVTSAVGVGGAELLVTWNSIALVG